MARLPASLATDRLPLSAGWQPHQLFAPHIDCWDPRNIDRDDSAPSKQPPNTGRMQLRPAATDAVCMGCSPLGLNGQWVVQPTDNGHAHMSRTLLLTAIFQPKHPTFSQQNIDFPLASQVDEKTAPDKMVSRTSVMVFSCLALETILTSNNLPSPSAGSATD